MNIIVDAALYMNGTKQATSSTMTVVRRRSGLMSRSTTTASSTGEAVTDLVARRPSLQLARTSSLPAVPMLEYQGFTTPTAFSRQVSTSIESSMTPVRSPSMPSSGMTLPDTAIVHRGGKKEIRRYSRDSVPQSVKALDYWKACEFFHLFDVKKNGHLDKQAFHRMLTGVMRDKEGALSKRECDQLFGEIDLDDSDTIELEEWLGWVFATHSNYSGGVRKRLEILQPERVVQYFNQIDKYHTGEVNKDQFFNFISHFATDPMSREATNELFDFIDADRSGKIDVDEFLDWVHPGRKLARMEGMVARLEKTTLGQRRKTISDVSIFAPTEHRKAICEMRPNEAVVLEFTIGKGYEPTLAMLKKFLRRDFDSSQIQIVAVQDPNTQACRKLVARVGRGIVLWDRFTMMTHMEDPFRSVDSANRWIGAVLIKTLPDVISAAHVRKAQKKLELTKKQTIG